MSNYLLLGVQCVLANGADTTTVLRVVPDSIVQGESITVSWNSTGTSDVLLLPFGIVPARGMRTVSPKSSMQFILSSHPSNTDPLCILRVKVIRPSRGLEHQPTFRHPFRLELKARSLTHLLAGVFYALQDSMGFSIHSSSEDNPPRYIYETNTAKAEPAVGQKGVRERRTFYKVELHRADVDTAPFTAVISAAVEYQRRAERQWRPEPNAELYMEQGRKLASVLRNLRL